MTPEDDLFDLKAVRTIASVVKEPDGDEHLLLSDGFRHLQLRVTGGTVLDGQVRLRSTLTGLQEMDRKVLSLRRLCLCCRLRRMQRSLYGPEPKVGRWIDKLRAVDAANADASQRDIAVALFGERRVAAEWSHGSDCLRLRVQRLIRDGRRMVRGGYRDLLA
ncbi:MAG: DUF2285 domain-containing protein [Niveispirillum sp.]|nr:DUF2285 domain-containing protein [Niveispirillum sp.]